MKASISIEDLRIVLVDDDECIRHSLDFYFRRKNVPFLSFATAEEALQHIRRNQTDLIISDYSLPGMNGLQFINELNQFAPDLAKILITGYGSLDVAVDAIRLGVHDFIQKPFSAKTLAASILTLMERKNGRIKGVHLNGCRVEESVTSACRECMELSVAKASHKINNSLLNISGNAEVGLLSLAPQHPVSQNLQRIVREVQEVTHYNKELMNLCQKPTDNKVSTDLSSIIRECIAKISHEAEKNHIDIRFDENNAPHIIKGKRQNLYHIVENILINAIQELSSIVKPMKQIVIAVQGTSSVKSIVVTDNGNGIAPTVLGRLAQKGCTTKEEGHGFGLYIVKKLTEELGGSLDIKSEPSRGTRVEIKIPFEKQVDEEIADLNCQTWFLKKEVKL